MSELIDIFQNLDLSILTNRIIPILIALTVHELSHGLAAYALGDDTAKNMGRLTLNPIKHIDPVGLLMMFVFRFGWAKPVPVNPYNFKNPKAGMAYTAFAGPLSNFLLAALILIFQVPLIRAYLGGSMLADIALSTAVISVFLGVFNLLPIPPLDGSKIFISVLPDRQYQTVLQYERYGMFLLLALIWLGVFSGPLQVLMEGTLQLIIDFTGRISAFFFV